MFQFCTCISNIRVSFGAIETFYLLKVRFKTMESVINFLFQLFTQPICEDVLSICLIFNCCKDVIHLIQTQKILIVNVGIENFSNFSICRRRTGNGVNFHLYNSFPEHTNTLLTVSRKVPCRVTTGFNSL